MMAAYDLSRNPPTFDVVAFLAMAELERLRREEASIDVRISPGPKGGFRNDGLWPHTLDERVHMLYEVLVPVCRMLPSVTSVTVESRPVQNVFGAGQRFISLPYIVKALKAGCRPLRALAGSDPKLITFTLREATHHPARNSRTEHWLSAAQELERRGWKVRVIRDTRVERITLVERARLYASAVLNVGISNGPMWLAIFMDVPVLMLRPVTDAAGACYDTNFFAQHGIKRGGQLPNSPPYQRLVWQEDFNGNILAAVEEMLCLG
jgi:hypothetical protein